MPEGPVQIRILYTAEEVEARIEAMARQLYADFSDAPLCLLSIAEGALRFSEALVEPLRARGLRPQVLTLRARRSRGMSLEEVEIDHFDVAALDGRDVLVVDDIADEGRTLHAVLEVVALSEARSVRVAVLVDKRSRRLQEVRLDYVGFRVEAGWVVGFGMDIDGELRDLDEIGVVEGSEEREFP